MNFSPETILLLGNYRPSLPVARQLGRAGHTVIVGRSYSTAVEKSRYVSEIWRHCDMHGNTRKFLAQLRHYLTENPQISLIFPISENCLTTLITHTDKITRPIVSVHPGTVKKCLDKGKMAQLADTINVPQAAFAIAANQKELVLAGEKVGFPCVARPNDGRMHSVKAYYLHDSRQMAELFPSWPAEHSSLLVQALVRGPRYNRYFVAHEGRTLQYVDVRISRTDRVNGSGYAVEGMTVTPPDSLSEASDKLIQKLGYSGVGCIQFMVDEAHEQISFLEINPRLGGNYAFPLYCGLDLVTPMLALARNMPLEAWVTPCSYRKGIRYTWLYGDFLGLISSLSKGEVGPLSSVRWCASMCLSLARADMHLTLDWHDKRPSLYYLQRVAEALPALAANLMRRAAKKLSEIFTL
jgi:predicted ATP-grasp superfamily ATP-dependent carboligase